MKYTVESGDRLVNIEVNGEGEDLSLGEGDESQSVRFRIIGDRAVLHLGNRTIEGYVSVTEDGYNVVLDGRTYSLTVADAKARALAGSAAKQAKTGGTVKAPMPGLVKAINVAVGDTVEKGTSLIILEAMKMENELTAPGPGTVKDVKVAAGAVVDQGAVLVVLE